ncbi:MAG: EscU/YscU/HrcU family type III secretion system export apparatus switch protein [Nocardioidaceae bacterium]
MSEERTERATPKKLKQSRREGRVARTPDLGGWLAVLVVTVALHALVAHGMDSVRGMLTEALQAAQVPRTGDAVVLLRHAAKVTLVLAVGIGALVMVVGVAAAAAQGGLFVATKALKPQWSRVNPLGGAKKLLGPHALWEGAKMLLKSAFVGLFVWRSIHALMPLVGGLVPIPVALQLATDAATGLMRDLALAGLVAAAADYAVQRRRVGKQVRMTKKEVRDEHKASEGDPLVRSAIRSRQLAAARSRMIADVPTADVVLVNPTHVAVALRYERRRGTPRVVAKGAGVVATRIRQVAEEHRVPLVEDVPLARALYAGCEVGQEIPSELYHAVAQVLAFVLSRRAAGASGGRHRTPRDPAPLPEVPRHRRRPAGADPSGTAPAGR